MRSCSNCLSLFPAYSLKPFTALFLRHSKSQFAKERAHTPFRVFICVHNYMTDKIYQQPPPPTRLPRFGTWRWTRAPQKGFPSIPHIPFKNVSKWINCAWTAPRQRSLCNWSTLNNARSSLRRLCVPSRKKYCVRCTIYYDCPFFSNETDNEVNIQFVFEHLIN